MPQCDLFAVTIEFINRFAAMLTGRAFLACWLAVAQNLFLWTYPVFQFEHQEYPGGFVLAWLSYCLFPDYR